MKPILENFPSLEALILDMDGVLWRDKESIGDLPRIFSQIEHLGLKMVLATNNASRNIAEYQEKLEGFGVPLAEEHIITSAQACVSYLQDHFSQHARIFVVGSPSLVGTVQAGGFAIQTAEEEADAVVAGLDRDFTYSKLRIATMAIYRGAAFIGTNPDKTYPTPEGLVPGAGSILAAIEAATGVTPTIVGKPSPIMYQTAITRLGVSPSNTLAVGDRFDTDIVGGKRAGLKTALLLSGVENPSDQSRWIPAPDCIANDLTELIFGS